MINESTIVGYVLAAAVLIGGFIITILKLYKPLQDLNMNIVKLTTALSFIVKEQDHLKERMKKYDEALDLLHSQVATLNTKIEDFEKRSL